MGDQILIKFARLEFCGAARAFEYETRANGDGRHTRRCALSYSINSNYWKIRV